MSRAVSLEVLAVKALVFPAGGSGVLTPGRVPFGPATLGRL
jgi:hypothetical protein